MLALLSIFIGLMYTLWLAIIFIYLYIYMCVDVVLFFYSFSLYFLFMVGGGVVWGSLMVFLLVLSLRFSHAGLSSLCRVTKYVPIACIIIMWCHVSCDAYSDC